jgi:hypothetical protein
LGEISNFQTASEIYDPAAIHSINGAIVTDVRGVVLHFKFLHDFLRRTKEEIIGGQDADNASLV